MSINLSLDSPGSWLLAPFSLSPADYREIGAWLSAHGCYTLDNLDRAILKHFAGERLEPSDFAPKVDSKTPDAVSPAPPSPVDHPFASVLRDATTSEAAPFDPVSYSLKFGVSKSPASSPTGFRKISEAKSEDRPEPPVPHVGWRERHERNATDLRANPKFLSSALVEEWRQEWRELVRGVETDIFSDWTQFLTRQVETYFAEPRSRAPKPVACSVVSTLSFPYKPGMEIYDYVFNEDHTVVSCSLPAVEKYRDKWYCQKHYDSEQFLEKWLEKRDSSSTTGDVVYHKEVTPDGRIVDALPLQTGSQTQEWKYVAPDRSLEFRVSSLENRIPYILKTASEFGDLRKRLSQLESKSEPTFHFFDVIAGQPEVTLTLPQTIKRLHRMIGEVHDRITKLESK